MSSTLDKQNERGFFALLKGDSGAGKSTGALSFPTPYVFDFDDKMPAIALKHFPGKEVHYDTFSDIFKVSEKIDELSNFCPYETIINDSITSLVVKILNSIGDIKGEKAIDLLKRLRRTRTGNEQLELMGYDYYNGETNFIQRYWIDAMKSLWARPGNPKHILFIAHVMTNESAPDIKTKVITTTRRLVTAGRAVAAYIPAQFDDMWHFGYEIDFSTGTNKRLMMTDVCGVEATKIDSAKTAYKLPSKIDFTNKNLYEILMKHINGDITA